MEWGTPPDLFAKLNRRFLFDYDAFASRTNHLLNYYSSLDGTFIYDNQVSRDTGLEHSWRNLRVFMNPPYSRGLIEQCMEKAYNERNEAAIIVALIPSATETQWFQKYVLPHCHIDWLPRRIRFIDPKTGKPGNSPPSGYVLATFKTEGLT